MSTFTAIPSSAAVSVTPRIRTSRFGDGYEQRVADGINASPRTWSLVFNQTNAVADTTIAFLEALQGDSFDWTPPCGTAGKWVAREWSVSVIGTTARQINVAFVEVFE